MAFRSPPPSQSSLLLLLLLLLLIATAANSLESENMQQALRNYGYSLFTNGIATTDLKYQLLADSAAAPTSNFTLFAPRDELLYALDMATDAAVYVGALRYHVVPNCRHTFADLKNLSVPFLDTLLPDYAVLVGKVRDVDVASDRVAIAVVVDGVRVTFPDLFVGSTIAVHGIDGILLTGLNMSRDVDDNDHIPPVGSPAPGVDTNIPSENGPSTSPPPANGFDGNVPPEGNLTPQSQLDPPAPADEVNIPADWGLNPGVLTPKEEGTPINPTAHFDGDYALDLPAKGSSTIPEPHIGQRNAPAPGIVTNPASQFVWRTKPAPAIPKTSQEHTGKVKKLKWKQPGKSHRKGYRRYKRRSVLGDL